MVVSYGFDSLPADMRAVITVGSFDGVHLGHRTLLDSLVAMSQRLDAESVVVTFEPHPRIAMGRAEGMKLLTTVEERALLLARYGVDRVIVAHFDDNFRSQTYEEFVRMLICKAGMRGMVVGYNHRFGSNRGSYDNLLPLVEEYGFELTDCKMEQEGSEWRFVSGITDDATFSLGKFTFEKFTRYVNHIVYLFDKWTVSGRLLNGDTSVEPLLKAFTAAQIREFVKLTTDKELTEVTAMLLQYQTEHFAEFDPLAEFTLDL